MMCPLKMSGLESAIRLVLDFTKALNRHDVDGMMAMMCDDCEYENFNPAPDGTVFSGKEQVSHYWTEFFREFPNSRVKIEDISSSGERCVMRWVFSWKDAAGDDRHIRGVDTFKERSGLIREQYSYIKGEIG